MTLKLHYVVVGVGERRLVKGEEMKRASARCEERENGSWGNVKSEVENGAKESVNPSGQFKRPFITNHPQ